MRSVQTPCDLLVADAAPAMSRGRQGFSAIYAVAEHFVQARAGTAGQSGIAAAVTRSMRKLCG